MKASAYCGLVVVDIAASERDYAAVDVDATSALPNKGGARIWSVPP